jgi:hypothetical protein
VAARSSNAVQARIRAAGFPMAKDFDTFDRLSAAIGSNKLFQVRNIGRNPCLNRKTDTSNASATKRT